MGAVAVISVLDQSDMSAHICALMPSGRRLRQITISLMTACLFTYRPRSSLNQCTAACWRKSSAPRFNQLRMEASQSSGIGVNLYFLFTVKLGLCLFFFSFLLFHFFLFFLWQFCKCQHRLFVLNCRAEHYLFKKRCWW